MSSVKINSETNEKQNTRDTYSKKDEKIQNA
jgi:hypothetical protein